MTGVLEKPKQIQLPLRSAYLCVECETIGDEPRTCAACGSRVLLYLLPVLQTIKKEEEKH